MARYSLGKATGSTGKQTSKKHTPVGDTLGAQTVTPIEEIRKPQLVPQKWQGNTFISNPSPTLVPQLKLPSVKGVIPEPNRDFAQLARALSVFDTSLVKYAKSEINLGDARRKYYDKEAERIIGQNPEGGSGTAVDQLASLQASLNKVAELKPYTQEDVDAGTIEKDKIGTYPDGQTIETVESARNQVNYIKTNSRLSEAIQSKYKERDYLANASALATAQKTATIKGTKVIKEDDGSGNMIKRTIEVDIPIHTLSPNDPRYRTYVDNFLNRKGIQLNSFEYNNVKGKLVQYRTNAYTSQSANYSVHLDNEMFGRIVETTTDIGRRLANNEISVPDATHEIQELLEAMQIHGTSAENKKKFNEELATNLIAAFAKGSETGYSDPAIVKSILNGLMIGPKQSRVSLKGVRNDKQLWVNEFGAGWIEERYNDALQRIKGHDEKAQKNLNSKVAGIANTHYEKSIRPLLFEKGELAPENMNTAILKLREWEKEQLEVAKTVEEQDAIQKAVKNLEGIIYGNFAGDYKNDSAMLNRLFYEAIDDPNKMGRFKFYLSEFNSRWAGYSKADDLSQKLLSRSKVIEGQSREKVLDVFNDTLNKIEKWYVDKYGKLHTSEGGTSNIEEQSNWTIMRMNLLNKIFTELGPNPSEAEIAAKLKEITDMFSGPFGGVMGTSDKEIKIALPFLQPLLDGRRIDYGPRYEDGPRFKGDGNTALSTFNAIYDPENTGNTKLNWETRRDIKNIFESTQSFFDADTLRELTDTMFKDGTKEINFDPRLKVLINNLPGNYKGKVGQFLLIEFEKHGIKLDEEYKTLITGLDNVEISSLLLSGSYTV